MKKPGKIIVFEGPDGTGKSSLAKALQDNLINQGSPWVIINFPGNEEGSLGKHIYTLHHNPQNFGIDRVYSESLQILHIAAHIDCIETRIKPLIEQGNNIILDRFWWSTWVYGKASDVNEYALQQMINLEISHWKNYIPAVVFFIDRENSLRDDMGGETWDKLRSFYTELSEKEKNKYPIYIIQNDFKLEEALNTIIGILGRENDRRKRRVSRHNDTGSKPIEIRTRNQQLSFVDEPLITYRDKSFSTINISVRLSPAVPTEVYDAYWYFAAERQNVFFRKFYGSLPPWTNDPIIARYKFTNAYRASDRVSQYLNRNVIYQGEQSPEELFFRIILYKVFNRISTWELLESKFGKVSYAEYSFQKYDKVLKQAIKEGNQIFSAAYIMPTGGKTSRFSNKHQVFLTLIERMMQEGVPYKIGAAKSMRAGFEILRSYPMIGDFLGYQFITDINYSELTNFSESEFVVPGPGAKNGIHKCFKNLGGLNETEIIKLTADRQEEEFSRLGIEFKSLWGRKLQYIDCQNLFCEVDKFARVAYPNVEGLSNRKRIKQIYKSQQGKIDYWYPPKWQINELIHRDKP